VVVIERAPIGRRRLPRKQRVQQGAQGMGGLMSVTGLPGGGPVRAGIPVADLSAGLYLAIGVLVALHDRDRTGTGRWVQTSLLESMIAMMDFQAARRTIDGQVPGQEGNDHPALVPMGCFATADGYVNIGAFGTPSWATWPKPPVGPAVRPRYGT
jgi:crotonobetainyl-CoA:carnitine CoA-transferase CaiB-like acyl-CoA transferase